MRRRADRVRALATLRESLHRGISGCLILFVAACASAPVATIDFDSRYDFSGVQAIALQPIDRTTAANVVIPDLQVERINAALSAELQRRGYRVVAPAAEADMLLAWHLVTDEHDDFTGFAFGNGLGCSSCGRQVGVDVSSARRHERGSFIVDLLDPVQLRTVWRATLETDLDRDADAGESGADLRAVAREIFAQFPPA